MIEIVNDPTIVPSYSGSSLYGNFRTRTFTDIYTQFEDFFKDYNECEIPKVLSDENIKTVYYLLYSFYGNSCISSSDENQFKYKMFSIIFMYGPSWQKRLDIQNKLVKLSDDEIVKGSTAIYNAAYNPSTEPNDQTLEELNYINSQNTTKYKKSKIEGYAMLFDIVRTDVTRDFIDKFKKLFITIVEPQLPLWYENEGE